MNHPLVRLAALVIVAAVVGALAYRSWNLQVAEVNHQLEMERLRREFVERDALARSVPDALRYQEEIRALLKSYFAGLTEHGNRFPGFRNYARFEDELAEKRKGKKVKELELAQYEERYRATRAVWDAARAGQYAPLFTAGERGLRLDVLEVQPLPDAKEPRLRIVFVLWGAQRKWIEDAAAGVRVRRLSVNASFPDFSLEGLDGAEKPIARLRASDPFRVESPERFIDEFPPGALIGYYDVPKIPAEVVTAELTFEVATRSVLTGDEASARFVWKLPAPAEWKMAPGAKWEGAQEEIREEARQAGAKGRK